MGYSISSAKVPPCPPPQTIWSRFSSFGFNSTRCRRVCISMISFTFFVSVYLRFACLAAGTTTSRSSISSVFLANNPSVTVNRGPLAQNSTTHSLPRSSTTIPPAHSVFPSTANNASVAHAHTTNAPPPPTVTSSPNASSTSSLQNTFFTLDPDLALIAPRRIDFVISQQSGANNIPAWIDSLGADGKWPDAEVDYTTGCPARRANWPAQEHWHRLGAMAAAWHGGFPGADPGYVQNASLRAQVGSGMDWWFARDFTVDACLDNGGSAACPCGTSGLWNTNWFSNVILIPRLVGQTCLLLNSTLTPSQFANCTHMTMRTYSTFMRPVPPGWLVGANLLDIASISIASGLLTGNGSLVADAYSRVHNEVTVQTGFQKDGILEDGSFGQHSGILYNGNYGKDYSNDVLELEIEGGGTRFAAAGESKASFESLMNASQWMIYQNTRTGVLHWDFSTEGRFISFPVIDAQATGSININLTEVQELGTLWNSQVLLNVYNGLKTNSSTANVGNLVGNRMFWNNDYMVTRGNKYVSTLKMYSSRTRNSECINSQNLLGFHLADGTTYTYVNGDEYEDISAAWDWNLIPGITVDYGGTALTCGTVNQVGVESFVGGVSTGKIGAAAMRFTNPLTRSLSFQKAWFYFMDDVQHVMVSVLVNSSTPVFSVLDQCKRSGTIFVDDNPALDGNFSHPRTLFHAMTGYHFVNAPSLSIATGPRTGSWSAIGTSSQPPETLDLFAAWIPHSTEGGHANPGNINGSVAYTVFPGRTRMEFQADVATHKLNTLRADTEVSAVQDPAHATTMAVFWQPQGGMVNITGTPALSVLVDSACVTILDLHAWTVTVADPTQLLQQVRMTFDVHEPKPPGWGTNKTKVLDIVLPAPPVSGSSVSLSLL